MTSGNHLAQYFDKGAKRMNREVLHYRREEAEPLLPSAEDLREIDRAIARFWKLRRPRKSSHKKDC